MKRVIVLVSGCVWLMGCTASSANSEADRAGDTDSQYSDSSEEEGFTPLDFDRQCTGVDCDFRMFEGEKMLRGLSTWHPRDKGFSFEGDPVLISVVDRFAAHPEVPVDCYSVSVLGDWDADTHITLEVTGEYGVFGLTQEESQAEVLPISDAEGEFLFTREILSRNWKPFHLSIRTLKHRGQLTFSIRKEGSGQAVFYAIEVDGQMECPADAVGVD